MDKLDQEIDRKRKELADLKRQVEARELELGILTKAASLRPLASPSPATVALSTKHRAYLGTARIISSRPRLIGRQPGAISRPWRAVLNGIYAKGRNRLHNIAEINLLAESAGLKLQGGSTQARVKKYVELGFLDDVEGNYRVTEAAVERFELDKKNEP